MLKTRAFTQSIKISIQPEHEVRLQAIEEEDYSGIIRKVKEIYKAEYGYEPTEEYITSGIEGLKQYYAIALLDPLNSHAVSPKIDKFWHAHMLHSKQYQEFCDKVAGSFMHHAPLNPENEVETSNIRILYNYTLEVMGKLFKELSPSNWPTEDSADYQLICAHFGDSYSPVSSIALFPRDKRGELFFV